jgi:transposase
MTSKELSVGLYDKIVMRHIAGGKYKTISRVLKVSKRTVISIIATGKKYGTTQTQPRAGRPTKLSNWARRTSGREATCF